MRIQTNRKINFSLLLFLALSSYPLVISSSNVYADWTSLTSGTNSALNGIHFVNANTGWAVGVNGIILKTTNGGTTWSVQTSGVPSVLRDIRMFNSTLGWAVGDDGMVLKTSNGGSKWQSKSSGISDILFSVFSPDGTNVWVVGANGKIRRSTNSGNSWSAQDSGTSNGLRSVYFVNSSTGWAVGDSGTIRKTVNGGSTWTGQTVGANTLRSVFFTNVSTGWAVGDSGTILKSTDSGNSWFAQASGIGTALNSVQFSSATRGWAVGDSGAIRTTFNGGETWVADVNASGNTNALRDLSLLNAALGFSAGDAGTILKSTNDVVSTYAIEGTIRDTVGNLFPGVVVTLSGSVSSTTVTASDGTYRFYNLSNGNYTVTPSSTNFFFHPAARSFSNLISDQSSQDFQGSSATTVITISGNVRKADGSGIANVQMSLTGTVAGEQLTDTNGAYSFTVPTGTYTLTPFLVDYTFSPPDRSYSAIQTNQTAQDFTGTQFFSIDGTVTLSTGGALAGWEIKLTGNSSASATTDSTGFYIFEGLTAGNYTVAPATATGFSFSPLSRSYSPLSSNQTSQDFVRSVASTITFSISGFVTDSSGIGIANITITLTGAATGSVLSGATGYYQFVSLSTGNYTVTPSTNSTYTSFFPTSISSSPLVGNVTTYNFIAVKVAVKTLEEAQGELKVINNLLELSKVGETATIQYTIKNSGKVTIRIFSLQGELLNTLFEDQQEAGTYTLEWNGTDSNGVPLASGIYLVHIAANKFSQAYKIAVIR